MTIVIDYRTRCTCDKCGKKVIRYSPDDEAPMPDGWAEVAIAVWHDGKRDASRGNEQRFCQLCPKCQRELGWYVPAASNEETP